ncbi:MAG: hypothetical protein Q9187_000444 [Circinaria calcarea]
MSATAQGSASTAKLIASDKPSSEPAVDTSKHAAALEEDDEFEDFPVDDWPQEDAEVPGGNTHLWEESWDDDDTSEDFSKQLKEELDKVKANK